MSEPADRRAHDPADRTALAWTRTSFAFLANGALLTIRNLHGPLRVTEVVPAFLAAAVALGTYLIAVQRQRTLQQDPVPARITPRRQVYLLGIAVLVLIVATMIGQLF
ncbi:DUF202 domain-containing protein [Mycobacterium sp. 852002-51057_SCH5723018]|uniref:DUF202 domain-containing protein n=1 Tax=Mycobacterium sp. 852002-51057_SCH5723018 TaxID=1834094 RepID=UPI000800684D|nr:DUF202 domain-containing protein [Mycobacterium sp. 852002-51057_SCH5723018]OBG19362.1 hypothetical protein A5764_17190 [Mycobacterium sp. 852002-51057_SCH5723018]